MIISISTLKNSLKFAYDFSRQKEEMIQVKFILRNKLNKALLTWQNWFCLPRKPSRFISFFDYDKSHFWLFSQQDKYMTKQFALFFITTIDVVRLKNHMFSVCIH